MQMPLLFLFARSRGLWEGEDGKNGRTKRDDVVKLRCIAASARTEGPRTRSARSPEQWPQCDAFGATFCHGAGEIAGRLTVKPSS
jgi:hypothetical protein